MRVGSLTGPDSPADCRSVQRVRHQCHFPGALNGGCNAALVAPAGTGLSRLLDAAAVIDEPLQQGHVLVVDHIPIGIGTEDAYLPAPSSSAASVGSSWSTGPARAATAS